MAVETLRFQQLVRVVPHHEGIVEWRSELDVANVSRTIIDRHPARCTGRLVVKWGHSKMLVMQTLLGRFVQMVKGLLVDDLLDTEFLYFFVGVELECHPSKAILDGVFIKSVAS